MPADIVNLNKARKAKARDEKEKRAEENRAKSGRTKVARLKEDDERARRGALLDGAKREVGEIKPDNLDRDRRHGGEDDQ